MFTLTSISRLLASFCAVSILVLGRLVFAEAAVDEIKVGGMLSLTGNWAQLSKNIQQGMLLATEEINKSGGVLGRPIRLEIEDTDEEKSGGKVISAYRSLRAHGVNLLIGPIGAPGFLALNPIAIKDNIVLITPSSPGSFYKNSEKFFNTGGDNYTTTKAIAERAYAEGQRKIAIFGSLQPWEHEQARIFREVFTQLGGSIVSEVAPESGQTVFNTEALQIVHSNPDAIFFAIFNQIAPAARAVKQLRYRGKEYAAFLDEAHLAGSEGGLQDAEVFLFKSPSKQFVEKYQSRFNEPAEIFADSAYDAVYALAAAIKAAGSADPEKVIPALSIVHPQGSGETPITFDADGLLNRELVLHKVNGKRIVIP